MAFNRLAFIVIPSIIILVISNLTFSHTHLQDLQDMTDDFYHQPFQHEENALNNLVQNASISKVKEQGRRSGTAEQQSDEQLSRLHLPDSDVNRTSHQNSVADPFLTMYGAHRVQPSMRNLPMWLQDYFSWHNEQTEGSARNSTKFMVVTCLDKDMCGGFSDRLRALPFFLLAGNVTRRAICIHWSKPYGLDEFFEPPPGGIDWRCPKEVGETLDIQKTSRRQAIPYTEFGNDKNISMVESVEKTFKKLKKLDGERFVLVRLKAKNMGKSTN
eukprot:CAMPEP_0204621464 /NCGR_PEP_ID=MMETSP0717-20131115/7160_1 /ASSEMBLY_ACC=CAM_ASM_000666 /TAXON_ID=230516 /ORGANISM="Chaetoceros curvisetus" /LENGTH=271 /DNA_ID=CAMNT_0051635869 /DNA_START=47 /DNA_END=863 /DNA_ORIENTATION=+